MSQDAISPAQFGPAPSGHWLFHGNNIPNLDVIDPSYQGSNYNMHGAFGRTFSTNNPVEALQYARQAHFDAVARGDEDPGEPTVHVVHHDPDDIEPDPNGNPNGGAYFDTAEEALQYADDGGAVEFSHRGPLKVVGQISPEDAEEWSENSGWGPSWEARPPRHWY